VKGVRTVRKVRKVRKVRMVRMVRTASKARKVRTISPTTKCNRIKEGNSNWGLFLARLNVRVDRIRLYWIRT
jgi:hypothetical protein